MNGDFEREADALADVADRLADASIDMLAAAIRDSDGNVVKEAERIERELQKARRAVVKAEGILRGISSRRDD
ncbi:MAG: hypothetical protein ACKOA5_09980 [Actinomycetota bacterium]